MSSSHILLAVTGSIAAYKANSLCSSLVKKGHEVRVVMTRHAIDLTGEATLAALSRFPVLCDEFDHSYSALPIPHIDLAKWADICAIVPADANILAKAVCGLADDALSSTLLALTCPILAAPAMNVHMYENPATVSNIEALRKRGWYFVEPETGHLACLDEGKGRLADLGTIEEAIESILNPKKPLKGLKVVISAGPTQESIDPVRYITNHSTGKQGYAIAEKARDLGAKTVLVSGPVSLEKPEGVRVIDVKSALDMEKAVLDEAADADFVLMAAAIADYRPKETAPEKIKKSDGNMTIEMIRNPDILLELGKRKVPGQILCGFAMETQNLDENGRAKLEKKNCDLLAANNLRTAGAGFGTDTNVISLITKEGTQHLQQMSKEEVGELLLMKMLQMKKGDA